MLVLPREAPGSARRRGVYACNLKPPRLGNGVRNRLDVCYLAWVRTDDAFSCWDDVCTWLMTAGRYPSTGLDPMPFRVKVVPNEQPPRGFQEKLEATVHHEKFHVLLPNAKSVHFTNAGIPIPSNPIDPLACPSHPRDPRSHVTPFAREFYPDPASLRWRYIRRYILTKLDAAPPDETPFHARWLPS